MRCPNGYRQDPPKSGKCVKKTAKVTRKRASNGTRKSVSKKKKLTQKSSSKSSSSKSSSKMYEAKYMYVVDKIFPNYERDGVITLKPQQARKKIQTFINKNKDKIQPGDILFVGSTDDPEQGFTIIGNDYKAYTGDNGVDLPLQHRSRIPEHISYDKMLSNMGKFDLEMFGYMGEMRY